MTKKSGNSQPPAWLSLFMPPPPRKRKRSVTEQVVPQTETETAAAREQTQEHSVNPEPVTEKPKVAPAWEMPAPVKKRKEAPRWEIPAPVKKEKPAPAWKMPAPATEPLDAAAKEELLTQAIELHDAGVAGDPEAVVKAHKLLKKLRQSEAANSLVEAYYGSATSLLGRDATDPEERMKKANKGLKILDKVVKSDPDAVQARILRAYVSYRLPETYFHRTATAVEDFSYLVDRYQKDNKIFSAEFYWQILYDLGMAHKVLEQPADAQEVWRKLMEETTDPKYQQLLQQEGLLSDEIVEAAAPVVEQKPVVDISAGLDLHARALAGDRAATRRAFNYFSKLKEDEVDNPLVLAYYADSLSMMGRDDKDPTNMFSNAIQAMKMMDSAVNSDPDNIQVRLIRANHSFRLPESFFRRTATAISDFEYLIDRYEEDNSLFPEETYWQLLYDLGAAYKRLDMASESKSTWLKLLSLNPAPEYRNRIEQQTTHLGRIEAKLAMLSTPKDLLAEGIRLHDLGVAGNVEAAKMAHTILKKAHEMDPKDAEIQAYYGSSLALLGRDAADTKQMFGNTIQGLKMLKQAISRDMNNPRIRLLRAYLTFSLPESFFGLTKRAIKDFRAVKSAYEQGDSRVSEDLYWQVLYDLGIAHQRVGETGEAQKIWTKLLKVSTDPKYQAMVSNAQEELIY